MLFTPGRKCSPSLARFLGFTQLDAHELSLSATAAEEEAETVAYLVGHPSPGNPLGARSSQYRAQIGERLDVSALDDLREPIACDEPRIRCDRLQGIVTTSSAHGLSMPQEPGLDSRGTQRAVHTTYSELEAAKLYDLRASLNQIHQDSRRTGKADVLPRKYDWWHAAVQYTPPPAGKEARGLSMPINLAAAHKKVLQAEILCAQLRSLGKEIALDMRRRVGGDYRLPLETYFSACLGAARSCFFMLARTGGRQFKEVSSKWRNQTLDQEARARFNAMVNLRDRDVHYGELGAEALPKMIEIEDRGDHWNLYSHHHNAALFGPRPMTEHENPDGTLVRGTYGLQSTVGLYVDIGGCRIEAATACVNFIAQLQSLLRAAEGIEAGKDPAAGR